MQVGMYAVCLGRFRFRSALVSSVPPSRSVERERREWRRKAADLVEIEREKLFVRHPGSFASASLDTSLRGSQCNKFTDKHRRSGRPHTYSVEGFAMSLELWNTLATFGTFLVIAATAIAAIYQLRHMRGGNQIAVLGELRASQGTPEYVRVLHFVYSELASKMQDPAFRYQLANRTARTAENNEQISYAELIGDSYEMMVYSQKPG